MYDSSILRIPSHTAHTLEVLIYDTSTTNIKVDFRLQSVKQKKVSLNISILIQYLVDMLYILLVNILIYIMTTLFN